MEPGIFAALLHFLYTDSLPPPVTYAPAVTGTR
jgi:hypothetical protein